MLPMRTGKTLVTKFEYEDRPLIFHAILQEAAYWDHLANDTDPQTNPETWLYAKTNAEAFTRLRDKIEKMANERFPTVDTIN